MAHRYVTAGGYGLQMCRVAAHILNKQLRVADNIWPYTWWDRRVRDNNPHLKNLLCY
jgi:hypothetical protein